jgi:DNA-directed RNA polymerase specialized sigma subunit
MNTGYTSLTQLNRDGTLDMRSRADMIRKLAENLTEPDRTLVQMYLDHENSFRQMAQLLGVSEAAVARRVKKIISRIGDRDIMDVLAKSGTLNRRQKKIARDYFLRGLNVKKIAHKYKMTYYNTRKIINLLRKLPGRHKHKTTIRYY